MRLVSAIIQTVGNRNEFNCSDWTRSITAHSPNSVSCSYHFIFKWNAVAAARIARRSSQYYHCTCSSPVEDVERDYSNGSRGKRRADRWNGHRRDIRSCRECDDPLSTWRRGAWSGSCQHQRVFPRRRRLEDAFFQHAGRKHRQLHQ